MTCTRTTTTSSTSGCEPGETSAQSSSRPWRARRYNPDGTFRWTQSGVHKPLGPRIRGHGRGLWRRPLTNRTRPACTRPGEWFTFAGLARLDGVNGLNASIAEFPAAQALGAVLAPDYTFAAQELDLFFRLSGGLRGHIAREYHRESLFGVGFGYVFNGAPGVPFRPAHRQRRDSVRKGTGISRTRR